MSNVTQLDGSRFESEVLQSDQPVVVDFYASWCPPCRALAPLLDRLADEFAGQIKFVKVNSDEEPGLASSWDVQGLPTLIMFDNGQAVNQIVGLPQEAKLRNMLQQLVEQAGASSR